MKRIKTKLNFVANLKTILKYIKKCKTIVTLVTTSQSLVWGFLMPRFSWFSGMLSSLEKQEVYSMLSKSIRPKRRSVAAMAYKLLVTVLWLSLVIV